MKTTSALRLEDSFMAAPRAKENGAKFLVRKTNYDGKKNELRKIIAVFGCYIMNEL